MSPFVQGIQVKMITGDHLLIGKETARQLGMGTEVSVDAGCTLQ